MTAQDAAVDENIADVEASDMLADAVGEVKSEAPSEDSPWSDPESAKKYIEKLRKENASNRVKIKEYEPMVQEFKKFEEASKTDLQRAQEERDQLRNERDELRVEHARMSAASRFSIPSEMVELLGVGSSEEIEHRAELLAQHLKSVKPSSKPVESLKPGAAPSADRDSGDPNAWLRAMAGR